MIVLMAECCDECNDDPCAPCDGSGCVDSLGSYIFTRLTRYWIGPPVNIDGIPVNTGDLVDTYFYDPPRNINDTYVFSKVLVTNYLGWDEENDPEPEPTEHGIGEIEYENYFGCIPDPDNPGRSIKFQQPGSSIMNGYIVESDIVDGEVIVGGGYWRLVVS